MRRPRGRAGRPKQTCVVAAPGLEPGLPKAGMQILSLLCLPFHHAAYAQALLARQAHARRVHPTCALYKPDFGRERKSGWPEATGGCRLLLERVAPDGFPVLPADIGHAAVALVELIGNLKHRQHQPALGRPGDMAATALAPDELAGLDLEPRGGTFLVHELALEHVGLLDLHMLMVGKNGSGRKAHQRGDEPGPPVE